jgi:microsomal epoxide hydrolase
MKAFSGAQSPTIFPLAVAVYRNDIGEPVRKFAERDHTNIIRWKEFDRGGHFAALEQPETFVNDLRGFLGDLRTAGIPTH